MFIIQLVVLQGSSSNSSPSSGMTDADVRAMNAARYNLPLTSHILPNTLPYYPSRHGMSLVIFKFLSYLLSNIKLKENSRNPSLSSDIFLLWWPKCKSIWETCRRFVDQFLYRTYITGAVHRGASKLTTKVTEVVSNMGMAVVLE